MTVDTRLIIDHNVKVVEGQHKDKNGKVIGLDFEIHPKIFPGLVPGTMVATILSKDNEQFRAPVLWLELIKEE